MAPHAPVLTKDWRYFIPGQPSVITDESWRTRNALADRYYPQIFDLLAFGEDDLVDILMEVEPDAKPERYRPVGFPGDSRPIALLPRRSYLEWHLFRGIAPVARRPAISQSLRALVIERDGLVCGICLGHVEPSDVHLDHVKPFSRGGQTTLGNLRVTHSRCNMSKGARH